ncbi:MAG: hypothetical protein L3J74_14905 [Bacteroidales bacterium]|nr:hypothetical protein [Bacteroidales bacterium]
MADFDNDFLNIPSIEVPKVFFSEKTNRPFNKCSMCGNLLNEFELHFVEKAFGKSINSKEHELIFEYALCSECLESTREELSEESKNNIEMYFKLYVDVAERNKKLLSKNHIDLNSWIGKCIITGKPVSEEKEYVIGGAILGNRLILNVMPYAVSEKAMFEIQELLSKKTKDFLDGFQKKFFRRMSESAYPMVA